MQTALRRSAALALLTLVAGQAADAQEIRIGILQPLTGPSSKSGTENWVAMQIARDMINDRGGVPGHRRQVQYVLADVPTPAAAISETERVITKDGVKITAGSGVSPLAIPVSQAAERHAVFHWETAGAAEIITRRGH